MPSKTDIEQLKGILSQFDSDVIRKALAELNDRPIYNQLSIRDMPSPGSALSEGEDGRIPTTQLNDVERIILDSNLLPVHFLQEGAVVQRAIARVVAPSWLGTGFMVSDSLFLTNNHVLPETLTAQQARIEFNYQYDYNGVLQQVDTFSPQPQSFFHTNKTLDYTLVRLAPKSIIAPLALANYSDLHAVAGVSGNISDGFSPPVIKPVKVYAGKRWGFLPISKKVSYAVGQYVNMIQHPSGRSKELACQENTVDSVYSNVIRYTTDSEPGSSGSAVFNNGWELLALHHAAGDKIPNTNPPQWKNNEGIRIDKIAQDLINNFSTTNPSILKELGLI